MNRRHLIAFAMTAAILFGGISGGDVAAVAAGKVPVISLYRSEARYLKMPKNQKKKAVERYRYASSRPKVVSVSKKGKIKAKKAGTAVITMRKKGRKKEMFRYRVRVVDYVRNISVTSASQVVLNIGESSKIRAEVLPRTAGERRIEFSSRDEAVAKVSKNGEIVAVEEGITYIDVTGKGKKKNGKKTCKQILVYVNEKDVEVPDPVIPSGGDAVVAVPGRTAGPAVTQRPEGIGSPGGSLPPGETGKPASAEPAQTERPPEMTPPATSEPPAQTLEQCIAAIQPPGPETLLAASFVVSSQGRASTLYFLNKSYAGNVSLVIDGVLLQGAGSAESLLAALQQEAGAVLRGPYFTGADGNTRRIFRIGRKSASEPWVVQNRRDQTVYSFYVMAADTVYGTPYGLIVADGDTSSRIAVQ